MELFILSLSCSIVQKNTVELMGTGCVMNCLKQPPPPSFISVKFLAI